MGRSPAIAVLALFLSLALPCHVRAQGNPYLQPVGPKKFDDETLASAKELAGVPPGVKVVQVNEKCTQPSGALATIERTTNSQGAPQYTVTLYVPSLQAEMKRVQKTAVGPKAIGFIAHQLRHEMGHKCLKDNDAPDDSSSTSCSHLAIEYGAAQGSCDEVANLKSQADGTLDPAAKQELLDKARGLCNAHRESQVKLNQSATAVTACVCGSPAYAAPSGCPGVRLPPRAEGSNPCSVAGGGVVLSPCQACEGL